MVVVGFALVAAMVMSAGCGSDEPDQKAASVSTDAVLIALVDWAVESDPPPTTTSDEPPVVYITASNGDTIDAAAQASVVAATADDATVRFADERSEAIDDHEPTTNASTTTVCCSWSVNFRRTFRCPTSPWSATATSTTPASSS